MQTPAAVLAAFAPETELDLTVEGTLILEALDCALITGGRSPGIRDSMLALLAMTDLRALKDARRRGTVDDLLETAGRNRAPHELIAMLPAIAATIAAATHPAGDPDTSDGDSPDGEKKSSPAAAGG